MILTYIEYSISIILAISAMVFFAMSIYRGYKYSDKGLPTKKSTKENIKYLLLGMASFFSAIVIALAAAGDLSWDAILTFASIFIVLSIAIIATGIMNLGVANFLRSRNIKPIFWKDNDSSQNNNTIDITK